MKTYILFAGVNGAGKSTLYQALGSEITDMPRINTDEIVKTFGDWKNKERIRKRVQDGGHGIPDKDVERRYTESFQRLKDIIPVCDEVILYDNTTVFERIAIYYNGKLFWTKSSQPD